MRQYLDDTFLRNATDILDFVVEITSIVMKLLIKLERKENLI